jgi:ligand-binding SRPBCC domain-containing protein
MEEIQESVETATVSEEVPAEEPVETEVEEQETAEEDSETDADDESGQKKVTANERVRQALAKAKEAEDRALSVEHELKLIRDRFQEIEDATVKAKPYVDVDMDKVALKISTLEDLAAEARVEGTVEGRLKARQYLKEIQALEEALEQNDAAREQYETEQANRSKMQEYDQQNQAAFDKAAEFYRSEMKIPAEVWEAGGKWVAEQMEKDKVLQAEFRDRVKYQGPFPTLRWLHQLATDGLKQNQNVVQQKEQAKQKIPAAASSNPAKVKTAQVYDGMDMNEFVRIRNQQERERLH